MSVGECGERNEPYGDEVTQAGHTDGKYYVGTWPPEVRSTMSCSCV